MGRLLVPLGARDVRVEFHTGRIPGTSIVHFTADEELAARVRSLEGELATGDGSSK